MKEVEEIKKEIENIQEKYKKVYDFLKEILYVQEALDIDLELEYNESNYWAPLRLYIKDSKGKIINFHPEYGIKRYQGFRCDEELHTLVMLAPEVEKYIEKVCKKIQAVDLPKADTPLIDKLCS